MQATRPPARGPSRVAASKMAASGERLRVLLFSNSIAIGGMEEHIRLLAAYLDRNQFEVFAVWPDSEATEAFNRAMQDVTDHMALVTPDRRHGVWRQCLELWRLYRVLRSWRIQVMHMHSTTYRGQQLAFAAARIAGVRRVYVTEHGAPHERLPLLERISRNAFTVASDGIVCVSEKNLVARQKFIYTPKDRTFLVPNGVDVGAFPPIPRAELATLREELGIPADARIIGTVVRFEPDKRLDVLLDAFPAIRLSCPSAHLLLVGDGSLRPDLEAQAASLGLTNCVHFTGFQSNPKPFLGLMDAFVLPVPIGSMSIGLLEAMAMARAVVMTFGWKGEAVVHGVSGFCAEPNDAASIAKHVTAILADETLQRSLGVAARKRVEESFSARRVAQDLGSLYLRGTI